MNRQELYRAARQAVAARRQAVELDAIRRREELYALHPQLAQIDRSIAEFGASAAAAAAGGNAESRAAFLEKARAAAQDREETLRRLGMADGRLEPRYHCPLCHDTGKTGGVACSCVHEEMKRLRREEINKNGPLRLCRFENFRLDCYPETMQQEGGTLRPRATMANILQDCRDWAATFGPRSPSLYMFGYAGLGKTHLALSIAAQVLEAGHDVIYVSAESAFSLMERDRDAGEDLFASLLEADLLVLDDLGTEELSAHLRAKLYQLVNTRMGRRPTVYTSNICKQKVLEARYDEKIASRLLGDCHLMRFWGEDIRLQGRK